MGASAPAGLSRSRATISLCLAKPFAHGERPAQRDPKVVHDAEPVMQPHRRYTCETKLTGYAFGDCCTAGFEFEFRLNSMKIFCGRSPIISTLLTSGTRSSRWRMSRHES